MICKPKFFKGYQLCLKKNIIAASLQDIIRGIYPTCSVDTPAKHLLALFLVVSTTLELFFALYGIHPEYIS